MHIRLGDFPQKVGTTKRIWFRHPVGLYIEALHQIRKSLGINLLAIIFSNDTDKELEAILELNNIFRSPFAAAVSDLLVIANSTLIITSRLSYNLIGAYLGQAPSIWYEGKRDICGNGYLVKNSSLYEVEWMPGELFSKEFIEGVKNKLNSKNFGN